ncbi:MAG: hypothetical protein QM756_34855 [Polyangiaceae bacterium]
MHLRSLALATWLLLPSCIGPTPARFEPGESTSDAQRARPFADDSPFNVPIPTGPRLDERSAAMVQFLARRAGANALLYEFAIPIWDADAATPRALVTCSMSPQWGACPFEEGAPIPALAHAHSGSDGAMVVVDWRAQRSYEFWQFRRQGPSLITSWGSVQALDGSGFSDRGSSTAAGASRLGGVVRTFELEAGRIPHALVMSVDNSCARTFRTPARKTDGESTRDDCTPQGARLQLDPSIALDSNPRHHAR